MAKCTCASEAGRQVRALQEVHLAAAGEFGRGMSCEDGEAAAGGGLLVGRRWFERDRERRTRRRGHERPTGGPSLMKID